eukprot:1038475-Prorocentrum_minimum.AAC.2
MKRKHPMLIPTLLACILCFFRPLNPASILHYFHLVATRCWKVFHRFPSVMLLRCASVRATERSAAPVHAVNYISKAHMDKDHTKHRRINNNLQDMYQRPLTTAQEIGWTCMAPKSKDPLVADTGKLELNSRVKTDVTMGEGRCVTEYFMGR